MSSMDMLMEKGEIPLGPTHKEMQATTDCWERITQRWASSKGAQYKAVSMKLYKHKQQEWPHQVVLVHKHTHNYNDDDGGGGGDDGDDDNDDNNNNNERKGSYQFES